MKEGLTVALWATRLSYPVKSLKSWAALVEKKIIEAKESGAEILLMPEYAAEQWLHFAPPGLKPVEQPAWMAQHTPDALSLLKNLVLKHRILLISGSFPASFPGRTPPLANRAHIFFPDGTILTQDKLCLTPREKNPEGWQLSPGDDLNIFAWQGYRLCVLICLDIELPALSSKLAAEKVDMVFVPSMTKKLAGYHRVFDCAKARAIELQAAVAVVGVTGCAPGREANISGASFFLPCEEKFGHTGLLAHLPPSYEAAGAGELLTAHVPLADIRALRQNGAEAWPGVWTASHVHINKSKNG